MRKRRAATPPIDGLIDAVIAQIRPGGRVEGDDLARALLLAVAENDFLESRISPEVIHWRAWPPPGFAATSNASAGQRPVQKMRRNYATGRSTGDYGHYSTSI
jgi:hypothetical protein